MIAYGLKHGYRRVLSPTAYSMPSNLYVTMKILLLIQGSAKSVEHTTWQVCWQQWKLKD